MTRQPLSPIEQQVYHYLLDFLSEHTFQPSVREIAHQFSIPSTKSVADILASLEKKGYVGRVAGRSRGVTLIGFAGGAGTIPVPVMHLEEGRLALEAEDHLTLDRRIVPSDDAFLVRATHEPAPEFGIAVGDLVLVHPSARARETDAVIVRVASTVFVRRLTRRGATVVLEAPGAGTPVEFGPTDDYTVLGVFAGVIRALLPREL